MTIDRKLDWKPFHDPKSRDYSIRKILRHKDIEVRRVMWQEGTVLDQGSEGACVGFAWTGELLAQPFAPPEQPDETLANALASSYYRRAKKIDQWPGEDYDGTSVLAGAKIMKEEGFIRSYRWCFDIKDVRDTILTTGPVVIGIPWKSGMYETLSEGLVKVDGKSVGGHALVVTGFDPAMKIGGRVQPVFRWRNSWGSDYGQGGSGYIRYNDLEDLLKQTGEACVPLGRTVPVLDTGWNRFQHLFMRRLFK